MWRASRRAARNAKRAASKRGLGFAYYVEITAAAGTEPARVTFTDNGGVDVYVGTQSNGQGHETAFAQIVAERLGVPFESITVKQGDTELGEWRRHRRLALAQHGGRRAAGDLRRSDHARARLRPARCCRLAARMSASTSSKASARFRVAGSDRAMTVGELAVTLKREKLPGFEDGLDSDGTFNGEAPTFPNGCHVCEVEVDPETGKVDDRVAIRVLDDFGRVINPMLVAGQVHGGVVQGLGQALLENCVYDRGKRPADDGQLHRLRDAARRRHAGHRVRL